jgi:hypothetical protein
MAAMQAAPGITAAPPTPNDARDRAQVLRLRQTFQGALPQQVAMHVGLGCSLAMPMMLMMTPLMRGFDFFVGPPPIGGRIGLPITISCGRLAVSSDCGKQMRHRGECRGDTYKRECFCGECFCDTERGSSEERMMKW